MVDLVVDGDVADGDADVVELLDDDGRVVGTAPRSTVNGERTCRHGAFSVYLVDPAGRVLLSRRALTKRTWPGVWTNALCGRARPGEDGRAALARRARKELGVLVTHIDVLLPDFSYVARGPAGVVENELCPVYRAVVSDPGSLRPDPDEVMDVQWLRWGDLTEMAGRAPGLLSPWCVGQVGQMIARGLTPLPRMTPPDGIQCAVQDTLRGVDEALAASVDAIAASWGRLGVPPARVLPDDLPGWLRTLIGRRGKRIRSMMCHWGFIAAGGSPTGRQHTQLVVAAASIEMLHEFALLHDDVMDDSEIRRSRPAAHRQAAAWHEEARGRGDRAAFGRNLAVLLGDLALVEADRLAARLPSALQQEWHTMCLELVAGQRGDLTGAATGHVGLGDAGRVAALKSGSYTVLRPVLIGALAADAAGPALAALRAYGAHAGTAFALRDDLLGLWGDPQVTGKPAGDDLLTGKPTVLAALAAERLTGTAANALHRAGTDQMTPEDVAVITEAMDAAGIRDEVEDSIRCRVDKAIDALHRGPLSTAGIAGLVELTERLAWRSA